MVPSDSGWMRDGGAMFVLALPLYPPVREAKFGPQQ